jgi:hypothetical protein
VPIGMSGVRRERITSWDEIVKVPGEVAVTDLRSLLAHEQLVVVMDGDEVVGVVTQEAYLAGLWGRCAERVAPARRSSRSPLAPRDVARSRPLVPASGR